MCGFDKWRIVLLGLRGVSCCVTTCKWLFGERRLVRSPVSGELFNEVRNEDDRLASESAFEMDTLLPTFGPLHAFPLLPHMSIHRSVSACMTLICSSINFTNGQSAACFRSTSLPTSKSSLLTFSLMAPERMQRCMISAGKSLVPCRATKTRLLICLLIKSRRS